VEDIGGGDLDRGFDKSCAAWRAFVTFENLFLVGSFVGEVPSGISEAIN